MHRGHVYNVYVYIYMYLCIYASMYLWMYVRTYVRTYACMLYGYIGYTPIVLCVVLLLLNCQDGCSPQDHRHPLDPVFCAPEFVKWHFIFLQDLCHVSLSDLQGTSEWFIFSPASFGESSTDGFIQRSGGLKTFHLWPKGLVKHMFFPPKPY